MMMIVFIYLYLFQISFVCTNQLTEANFYNLVSVSSEDEQLINDITISKVKQGRNRVGGPQSLTLLMNFKDDGTTSFQILQGKFTSLNWSIDLYSFLLTRITNCLFGQWIL